MALSRKKWLGLILGASALYGVGPAMSPAQAYFGAEKAKQRTEADKAEQILFEADEITRNGADGPLVASGNVQAYFGDRYLESDMVTYDPTNDIVRAVGNVAITDAEGQTFFADEVVLDGELEDGIATNFGALLLDDSRLAGATVVKSGEGRNELNNAVYSACEVCNAEGDEKTPTWSVRSRRVVQDPKNKIIRFNDAVLEFLGLPVFYTPYLQIPDPSVERQSGLLTPSLGSSSLLGIYLEVPYYFAISDSQDATFSPKYMSDQGTLLQGEYRRRTRRGQFAIQAGAIGSDGVESLNVNNTTLLFNVPGFRYHLFAKGVQRFAENWQTDFDINHISDKRYLRSYNVEPEGDLKRDRGLYRPDRLRSTLSLSRITQNTLFNIQAVGFNSLRANENNDFVGQALPHITFVTEMDDLPALGGNLTLKGDLLSLWRKQGLNSNRAIASLTWERGFTTRAGHRFKSFAQMRADYYQYNDLLSGNEQCYNGLTGVDYATCIATLPGGGINDSQTSSRFLPTIGIEWSYPLAKKTTNATYVIGPKVQFVASPEKNYTADILNEDSQFFEFDAATLYDWSKGSGYDAWEDGQRINLGLSGLARFNNGLELEGLIGQQFRAAETTAFISAANLNPGIARTSSDVVGAVNLGWGPHFNLNSRFRLDSRDGTLRNNQTNFRGQVGPLSGVVSYLKILAGDQTSIDSSEDEYLTTNLRYKLTKRWQVGGGLRRDLGLNQTTTEMISLSYSDECTIFSIDYRNDRTRREGFDFDKSINVRLELRGFNG